MSDLGGKIKQLRIARNLTQTELADKLGVGRQYISKWESNERNINANQLMELAKVLGVTLDYFSDVSPDKTIFQLMVQLENLFADSGIPETDKDKAYQDVMKIYLNYKEMKSKSPKEAIPADKNTDSDIENNQ